MENMKQIEYVTLFVRIIIIASIIKVESFYNLYKKHLIVLMSLAA